ncbi:MAG: asparagine synthase C-terminal domain-containing protein [Thermomicrobiales bacterium]|nr:asparagine synthase C-terminal domain-containing protein [Thermomicrobiales bacterium]
MNDTPTRAVDALESALITATTEIRPDVLLLGAGVDSALLAAMWTKQGHRFRTITVGLDPAVRCVPAHTYLPYPCNSDLEWARRVAETLNLDWAPIALSLRDALHYLDMVMMQQRSFDLGQLNNIALYAALNRATGWDDRTTFASGDDADGLFGGYLNATEHADWGGWVRERIPHIDPPVRGIGEALNWQPMFPYLHRDVLTVAESLTQGDIRESLPVGSLPPSFMDQFDPTSLDATERTWGKVVLRRVGERYLPRELAWRPKTDLQFGSGMCALEPHLAKALNVGTRMQIEQTGMRFFNDAHRGLYSRYRSLGGVIPPVSEGQVACANCGGGVPEGKRHCHTCGWWE